MPVTNVNPTATDPHSAAANASNLPGKSLNQQDFLKLLVAQMTAQDPMNPQSNADFAAQMAQFSALQTAQDTEAQVAQLRAEQEMQQANSLLGRTVTVQNANGTISTGIVNSVQVNAGPAQIFVNGVAYQLTQVVGIKAPVSTQPTPPSPGSSSPPAARPPVQKILPPTSPSLGALNF